MKKVVLSSLGALFVFSLLVSVGGSKEAEFITPLPDSVVVEIAEFITPLPGSVAVDTL